MRVVLVPAGKLLSVKVNCQDFRAGGFKESEANSRTHIQF